MTGGHCHVQLLVEMGSRELCPGTVTLPISASYVARVTGVSLWCPASHIKCPGLCSDFYLSSKVNHGFLEVFFV
jgi:hypothetical protein